MLRLDRLPQTQAIAEQDGKPSSYFALLWKKTIESIELVVNAQGSILDAIVAANNAAAAANAAAVVAQAATDTTIAETSLVNSFPTAFTAPLISASSAGSVTIAAHSRQYGDTATNPTVAVAGAVIATGQASPAVVRVYYDDAARTGGAVTYAFTVDPASAPVQGGIRHSVGAVTIPAAGSAPGGNVRPPGYAEP